MQQNQSRLTSAPILSYRKRPRQALLSDPQSVQTEGILGPSGAATYPDLMPVGGFNGNMYQHRSFPTSGRGAANFNRNNNYNAYSNQQTGQSHQTGTNQRSYAQSSSGEYQPNLSRNNFQNGLPSGRGRSWTQAYNTFADTFNQSGPYSYGNSTSEYGYNQDAWNDGQHAYSNNRTVANKRCTPLYGCQPANIGNYQQQQHQPRNQIHPIHQESFMKKGIGRVGAGQNRRGGYRTNIYANTEANQAENIVGEWNNRVTESTSALPRPSSNNVVTKDAVKVSNTDKTAVSEVKKSLHFLTADIAGVKRWSNFKDSIQIVFELFGQLDSAVPRAKKDCKEFLIRDEKKDAVTCVFYEIDRQLQKMTRGQWYRIVGTYDGCKERFKCFSVRALQPTERNLAPLLTQKSSEIMCKLTQNIREP